MDGNVFLINLVRKRPVLWNKSFKETKDLAARNAAWKEIAAIINVQVDWIRTRWYNLRERFVKELKLSYSGKHHCKFKYYKEMLFLAKQVEFRRKLDSEFESFIQQLPDKKTWSNTEFEFTEEMFEANEPLDEESIFKELDDVEESSVCSQNDKIYFENCIDVKPINRFAHLKESESMDETASDVRKISGSPAYSVPDKEKQSEVVNSDVHTQEHRCEDAIFGELVTAILKKMSESKKKQAKKEIIGILLA